MVVVTDTDLQYKYYTTRHPFSNRYGTIATTISQYKIGTNSIVIDCTPIFHSNVLMKQGTLGYKVDGVDILADKSPRLLYDSAGVAETLTGQLIPSTATGLYVIMWGAGGGGGGGAYDATGSAGRGAGGGGSGQCIGFGLPVSTLTYALTTGYGGDPGLGGGSDNTYSSNTQTGGYGTGGSDTKFTYNGFSYIAHGGEGGGRGRVSNDYEGVAPARGYGGAGLTKGVAYGNGTTDISTTDPNVKTDGAAGLTNSGDTGGAGGAPIKFSRTAASFTSYNVAAVAGAGEPSTGTGSENYALSTFTRPMVADGMSKGGGGAGGNGDKPVGTGGGFTGVPGSHGHIRIYVYFDNAPAGRYL